MSTPIERAKVFENGINKGPLKLVELSLHILVIAAIHEDLLFIAECSREMITNLSNAATVMMHMNLYH